MNDKVQEQLEKLDKRKKDFQDTVKILKVFSVSLILFEIISSIIIYILFPKAVEIIMAWSILTPVALGTIFFMSGLEKKNIHHCEKFLCHRCGGVSFLQT